MRTPTFCTTPRGFIFVYGGRSGCFPLASAVVSIDESPLPIALASVTFATEENRRRTDRGIPSVLD